jgi:hypothetical protein
MRLEHERGSLRRALVTSSAVDTRAAGLTAARAVALAAAAASIAVLAVSLAQRAPSSRPRSALASAAVPSDPRPFSCGTLTCDARRSYCETINTDVKELPSNYACKPLPESCMPEPGGRLLDCRCFPSGTRGAFCSSPSRNGVQRFYRTTFGGH